MKKGSLFVFHLCLVLLFVKTVYSIGGRCSCMLQDTPNEYDIAKTEGCCDSTQDTGSYFNNATRFCQSDKVLGTITDPKAFAECCIRESGGSRRFYCKDILGESFDPTIP